ncbi:hypothetical protein EVAR_47186_1 [Eumeta japonica]|uniref:Uncharacterized protein n=1 Tax=Eumeta variegata TaxID=151549 RepID=A0A4C1WUW6_EUMVA|nr:hypothetical protein EVAR_47186_1 [Eumeta japonica]
MVHLAAESTLAPTAESTIAILFFFLTEKTYFIPDQSACLPSDRLTNCAGVMDAAACAESGPRGRDRAQIVVVLPPGHTERNNISRNIDATKELEERLTATTETSIRNETILIKSCMITVGASSFLTLRALVQLGAGGRLLTIVAADSARLGRTYSEKLAIIVYHEAVLEVLENWSADLRALKINFAPPRPKLAPAP